MQHALRFAPVDANNVIIVILYSRYLSRKRARNRLLEVVAQKSLPSKKKPDYNIWLKAGIFKILGRPHHPLIHQSRSLANGMPGPVSSGYGVENSTVF